MSFVAFWVNNCKYVGPSSMHCHMTLRAVGSFCRAKCSSFSHGLCFPLFYILLWLLHYFIYTFSIYSNSFSIYCSSIRRPFTPTPSPFTAPPLTSLTHLYQHTIISNFCLFFYCSDLSLVPFFHKLLLTQHKARGRRRSPSQKQAHPGTSNTGADTGLRIRPLPRWPCFLSLPP